MLLRRLLKAVIEELQPNDEILVLDTDPSDENAAIIADLNSEQVNYSTLKLEQFDFATARNALLQKAGNAAVVFIDDDAVPFPGWLEQVRYNLQAHHAGGGVTVSSAQLPDWWDPAINWCIGLSPPGTVLGKPGYYPDTCNMAARKQLWDAHPLCSVKRETRQLYSTGREDAEWWKDRRLQGCNVIVGYRQAVVHEVHPDRLTWAYVMNRARLDGEASWLRRPAFETATAIPWDLAHIAGVVADKIARSPLTRKKWVGDYVWLNRQWGVFRSVWSAPLPLRPRHRNLAKELGKAMAFQGKIRAGGLAFNIVKRARNRHDFPISTPGSIFVSADCLMGDSILLRPHINNLAHTFPKAEIVLSAKSPQLLAGMPPNVKVLAPAEASSYIRQKVANVSAAFVPYFYDGDYALWRKHLSPVGSTFNCDVGFAGRRDYIYARRQVEKNLELHEHENLARLFSLWPLVNSVPPAPPPVSEFSRQWLDKILNRHGIGTNYTLVQFGAGYASKEWPLDNWIPFLDRFGKESGSPIIIMGAANWAEAGGIAEAKLRHNTKCLSLAGKTSLEQVMALVNGASFLVGGCSGPKHLAVDYGVPTFTLYTATEPHRWGASRDHELHAYATALPQKLTALELHGLRDEHRPRLLKPDYVVEKALFHYAKVMRRG